MVELVNAEQISEPAKVSKQISGKAVALAFVDSFVRRSGGTSGGDDHGWDLFFVGDENASVITNHQHSFFFFFFFPLLRYVRGTYIG